MRTRLLTLLVINLMVASGAFASDLDGFESWEQYRSSRGSTEVESAVGAVSRDAGSTRDAPGTETEEDRAVVEEVEGSANVVDEEHDPLITFGAGATYLMPYRFADSEKANLTMAEFSVSLAPFGKYLEIGTDLAISRDNTFLARPNLKFFMAKGRYFSAYMQGSAVVLSQNSGTDVGGGAGLGVRIGFMENLAIDIRVTGAAFFMSAEAAGAFLGGSADDGVDESSFVGLFCAGAGLVARF